MTRKEPEQEAQSKRKGEITVARIREYVAELDAREKEVQALVRKLDPRQVTVIDMDGKTQMDRAIELIDAWLDNATKAANRAMREARRS